jgi:hypothetical protein
MIDPTTECLSRHGRAKPSKGRRRFRSPIPAIHGFFATKEDVDARIKSGHDGN